MVRRAPSLLRLAPLALLLGAGSCSHAPTKPPRPTLAQLEATCAPVWKSVHAEIDTRGSACTADWECRQVRPEYLGCDAWANLGYELTGGRVVELESACAPISFVPDCGERVGACVAGRCAGRKPVRSEEACPAAVAALEASLDRPAPCLAPSDCTLAGGPGDWRAAPATWKEVFARERAAVDEACVGRRPVEGGSYLRARAACTQGTCSLLSEASTPFPKVRKPVELEKGCVGRSVRLPVGMAGYAGAHTLKFRISRRGVPYAFELIDGPRVTPPGYEALDQARPAILIALGMAVSQCAFEPGQVGDGSEEIIVILPVRFATP